MPKSKITTLGSCPAYKNGRRVLLLLTDQQIMKSAHPNPQKQEIIAIIAYQTATFFLSLTELCIKELDQRIPQLPEQDRQRSSSEEKEEQDQELQQEQLEFSQKLKEEMDKPQQSEGQQKTKKKKRKKKTKGRPLYALNKPKAPTSSYLHFLHQSKSKIVAKYGVNLNSEVAKIASEEWKNLTQSQKQPYYKKSQQQKQRYHQAMKIFREAHAEEINQQKKRRTLKYRSKWLSKKKKQKSNPQPKKLKYQQNESSSQAINSNIGIVKSKRNKSQKKILPKFINPTPTPTPAPTPTLTPTLTLTPQKICPPQRQQSSSLQL